jgi:hypothetical protein
MECIECKVSSPDDSVYCGRCGAELGRSLEETTRKKFRDRRATEIEITEAVVGRLMKWGTWLASVSALIVALFGVVIGKGCVDAYTATQTAKKDIAKNVADAKNEVEPQLRAAREQVFELTQIVSGLKTETGQLQSDIGRYRQVNAQIGVLQKQLTTVQGQVIDLGSHTLRAHEIQVTGNGPTTLAFRSIGCNPATALEGGGKVAYCAEGSPPSLFQITAPAGDLRPVASSSPTGYQDLSTGPKPTCNTATRGTIYVEKGGNNAPDVPSLCMKHSDGSYGWMQLAMTSPK